MPIFKFDLFKEGFETDQVNKQIRGNSMFEGCML